MDGLYILNAQTKECLISKDFKDNDNLTKLQYFIQELDNVLAEEKSPYLTIKNSILTYLTNNEIIYVAILSEDNMTFSVTKILENIKKSIEYSLDHVNTESIRDNFINITLMIDQYLLKGVPVFNEPYVLSTLTSEKSFSDKITEKFVGKPKEYDTRTLNNYLKELQSSYDHIKFTNESYFPKYEVLFEMWDTIECRADKNFNFSRKLMKTELKMKSNYTTNVDLSLLLNIPYKIVDFTLDNSVKTNKKEFMKSKNLEILTKHGESNLICIIPTMNTVNLPFKITTSKQQVNNQSSISLNIELVSISNNFYSLKELEVKIVFPHFYENSNLSCSQGEFEFESKNGKKTGKWNIPKIDQPNGSAYLKGNLTIDELISNDQSILVSFNCVIENYSFTSTILEKVFVKDNKTHNFFKGKKSFTKVKNMEIII